MTMEFRNVKYNQRGTIDCELNHPVLGWIPFTADPNDVEELGREIYAEALKGEVGAYVAPPPVIPTRLNSKQFMLQLDASDLYDAVFAWVATQPRGVQLAFNHSTEFRRNDPMMQQGFTALGFTDAQIDQFFLEASAL